MKKYFLLGVLVLALFISVGSTTFAAKKKRVAIYAGPVTMHALGGTKDGAWCAVKNLIVYDDGSTSPYGGGDPSDEIVGVFYNGKCVSPAINPDKKDNGSNLGPDGVLKTFSNKTPMKGNKENLDVSAIEKVLKNEGLATNIDGIFGPAVEKSLRTYQKNHGLQQTGTFTAETKALMQKKLNELNGGIVPKDPKLPDGLPTDIQRGTTVQNPN